MTIARRRRAAFRQALLGRERVERREHGTLADAAPADVQWDAEPPLHLGEQDDSGREDLGSRAIDAVAPGDLAWRRRLDDPQRIGQLCLAELGADEPPR